MRKVQLTIKQEEVAPATTSDLVLMNNGRTLKEELSTHPLDKFSSTQTVTTSIEKIADGAYGGVYESGVMYGRTLVNLADLFSFDEDVTTSYHYVDRTVCETSKLKLNTSYLFIFKPNVSSNLNDYTTFEIGLGNSINHVAGHPSTVEGFRGYNIKHNQWNYIKKTFTDFKGYKYLTVRPLRTENPDSTKPITYNVKEGLVVLEYQEGMENWDIPYFEGICDVKMPALRNVGKNLLNPQSITYALSHTSTEIRMKNSLKPNVTYTISFDRNGISWAGRSFYVIGEGFSSYRSTKDFGSKRAGITFSLTDEEVNVLNNDDKSFIQLYSVLVTSESLRPTNIQIEESPTQTTYEEYKTNILHTPETVTLRSLPNGVRDELNLKTGEYIKRIGEIVLNGSEGWASHSTGTVNGTTAYRYRTNVSNMLITNQLGETPQIFCDKLPCVRDTQEEIWSTVPSILRRIASDYGAIYIVASASTVDAFKQWLSQNPITVQYELAEPITTIVEPLTIPFAYENGHIILESGSEEQSLLPELKYSVPASKNGVLSTTSQAILKHEQRLHKLENLLLREAILMDYRLTLSFLDKM